MTVSVDRDALPATVIIRMAEPRVGLISEFLWIISGARAVRREDWNSFEPVFREVIREEFSGCRMEWMTVDEFISAGEPAGFN